jgi:hypothetical protein
MLRAGSAGAVSREVPIKDEKQFFDYVAGTSGLKRAIEDG